MKVHLPNSAFLGNIDPFIRGIDSSLPANLDVTANQNWISVHPVVLAIIASMGLKVKPENIHCAKLEATSKHYLVRMGLFKILGLATDIKVIEHESAGRFIPLTQIKTSNELTLFISEMIPLLHVQSEQAKTIGYIVSELVRNVLEHSVSAQGAVVCAQYYLKSNVIRLGIADSGIGIRASINQSYSVVSDLEAIQMALTPGITGKTRREGGTDLNAGAGLFFIKSIASVNRDFFMVYSGTGFYKLLKKTNKQFVLQADPFKDRHSREGDMPYWQGTAVGIDISLEQTEYFSRLLEAIHKTYSSAIRERKQSRLRKPKFI